MDNRDLYLREEVVIEPLYNQWYAWSFLIPPATAAMYVANSHIKVMQSFVSAPQFHISALKDPAMIGGPFMKFGPEKVNDVRALLDRTKKDCAGLLSLADAIRKLDEILSNEARGPSLELLYEKVPEALRGYVELVYDLNNNASIRIIEGLLYKSPYYDRASQSISLSLVDRDQRPFVFSTPRLEDGTCAIVRRAFDSESLDELFQMRFKSNPYGYIKELLGIDDEAIASYFTEEDAQEGRRYDGDGVRVRYFGHACALMESRQLSVLCDPNISYGHKGDRDRFTFADLPDCIDYVLITHNHQDHCLFETLIQLRYKIKNVVVPKNNGGGLADPSLKLILRRIGFRNIIELDEMESLDVPGGEIMSVPFLGEHGDLNIRSKTAYLVRIDGSSALFVADSNNLEPELYRLVGQIIQDLDILFIGMECDGAPMSWIYGPLMVKPTTRKIDQSRRLNGSDCTKAIDIIKKLRPKQVCVYAMGLEPWLKYITSIQYTDESRPIIESSKLVDYCNANGIGAERLFGKREFFFDSNQVTCRMTASQLSLKSSS
jgi:L-ascorbate metabolism protein UlaG (beta-lactamase superfamily)